MIIDSFSSNVCPSDTMRKQLIGATLKIVHALFVVIHIDDGGPQRRIVIKDHMAFEVCSSLSL